VVVIGALRERLQSMASAKKAPAGPDDPQKQGVAALSGGNAQSNRQTSGGSYQFSISTLWRLTDLPTEETCRPLAEPLVTAV
jgi:hypothetical protein